MYSKFIMKLVSLVYEIKKFICHIVYGKRYGMCSKVCKAKYLFR